MRFDILAYFVILIDLFTSAFLIWRAVTKSATLWGASRFVYFWIAAITFYHAMVYLYTIFLPASIEGIIVYKFIHPIVILYILNPLLVAIIHYRRGHL